MRTHAPNSQLPGELCLCLVYCAPDREPVRMATFVGSEVVSKMVHPVLPELAPLSRDLLEAALMRAFLLAALPELRPAVPTTAPAEPAPEKARVN